MSSPDLTPIASVVLIGTFCYLWWKNGALEKDVLKKKSKLQYLRMEITTRDVKINDLELRYSARNKQIKAMEQTISKMSGELQVERDANAVLGKKLQDLQFANEIKSERINRLEAENSRYNKRLQHLEVDKVKNGEKLRELESLTSLQAREILEIESQNSDISAVNKVLEEKVSSLVKEIEEIKSRKLLRKGSPWKSASPNSPRTRANPSVYNSPAEEPYIPTLESYTRKLQRGPYDENELETARKEIQKLVLLEKSSHSRASNDHDADFAAIVFLNAADIYYGPPSPLYEMGCEAAKEIFSESGIAGRFHVILHIERNKFNEGKCEQADDYIKFWKPKFYSDAFRLICQMPSEMRQERFQFMKNPEMRMTFIEWNKRFQRRDPESHNNQY